LQQNLPISDIGPGYSVTSSARLSPAISRNGALWNVDASVIPA
jgi:hypothetical protein